MLRNPKERVALSSVLAAIFLVSFKLYVGVITNSLGILSEALHSGLDLLAAAITMFAVITANKPADNEHQFGHGKVESFSALVETILLLLTCGWIIIEAVDRIFVTKSHAEASLAAFAIMGISIVIDISRSRALYKAAREHKSQALEADALHFSSDILSSSVVIIGLIFVKLGFPLGDPLAAVGVAVLVVIASLRLGKNTMDMLMDKAPKGKADEVRKNIETLEGVCCSDVRVRIAGPSAFADVKISLDRSMPLELSHDIASQVEQKVREVLDGADVMVHVEPRACADEDLASKLSLIALKEKGITGVHKMQVHRIDGDVIVDMHIEVSSQTKVKEAHELVSRFECKAKSELKIMEISTHIESQNCSEAIGKDVTKAYPAIVKQVRALAEQYAKDNEAVIDCHNIVVRDAGGKLSVNLHCDLDEDEPLETAHQLSTDLENILKSKINELDHVIIHIEPSAKKQASSGAFGDNSRGSLMHVGRLSTAQFSWH